MHACRLALIALASLSLSGCWVPQVIQGVQPEIFKTPPPAPPPVSTVSLESRLVALGSRMITVGKQSSALLRLSADLARHRQTIENQNYYRVQNAGDLTRWQFGDNGLYTYRDASTRSEYSLQVLTEGGAVPEPNFDVLGLGSYGPAPLPATTFPAHLRRYRLQMTQRDHQGQGDLSMQLNGQWPLQIPLRDAFVTTLTATGSQSDHPLIESLNLQLDGKSSSDAVLLDGQLAFSATLQGKVYNGFGRLDARGLVDTVHIEQNGVPVGKIVRETGRWDVYLGDKVLASGN